MSDKIDFINNKYLNEDLIQRRIYQEMLSVAAIENNILVVAPTGLGKTIIAILLISYIYNENKNVIFLAPTKPLITQHYKSLQKTLNICKENIILLTGSISANKRKDIYKKKGLIICATPQTIRNDINNKLLDVSNFNLIIFDEAHRAIGEYAYCEVSSYFPKEVRRLALTASPGSKKSKINEVADNLKIEKVEIKNEDDFDVIDYVNEINIETKLIELDLNSKKISRLLDIYIAKKIEFLKKLRFNINFNFSKKQLLDIQKFLFIKAKNSTNKFIFLGISNIAGIIKVLHAKELIETQGFYALEKYLHKMFVDHKNKKSKALSQFINSNELSRILEILHVSKDKLKYSKEIELLKIIKDFINKNPNSKILVFNNFRDNANYLTNLLNENEFIKAKRFVGQSNKLGDKGLSQREQTNIITEFRENKYNVLVCTSVGEEGLDIPAVDLVVFYDAVASEIRNIQRRGRTGRFNTGKVIVLINKDTIDEKYYFVSKNKEEKMKNLLTNYHFKPSSEISKTLKSPQKRISDF
jgi:ERCC4-related helicase